MSTAQVALDCLTENARMPAEGEALIAWMRKNERAAAEIAARTLALPDAQSVEDLTALLTSAGER